MSIFRRRSDTSTLERPAEATAACEARGCTSTAATLCGYQDRRGRSCQMSVCPDHAVMVGGVRYCRRHGSTVRALGPHAGDPLAHPDLDNRAPSLVNWVADDLDEPTRELLSKLAHDGERVLTDSEVTLLHDQNRQPRWERSWRLVDHTGVIVKITVIVHEEDDAVVGVRVGSDDVVRAMPPWIERRRRGVEASDELDASQRRIFYRFIEENIAATAERLREASDHPVWTQ